MIVNSGNPFEKTRQIVDKPPMINQSSEAKTISVIPNAQSCHVKRFLSARDTQPVMLQSRLSTKVFL